MVECESLVPEVMGSSPAAAFFYFSKNTRKITSITRIHVNDKSWTRENHVYRIISAELQCVHQKTKQHFYTGKSLISTTKLRPF